MQMIYPLVILAVAVSAVAGSCSSGWTQYQGKCHKVFENQDKNWNDAKEACIAEGGNLESLHSDGEMEALDRGRPDYFWIGLFQESADSAYQWSDGSALDYTRWSNGEPNNAGGDFFEGCVRSVYGPKWNDVKCSDLNAYACMKTATMDYEW